MIIRQITFLLLLAFSSMSLYASEIMGVVVWGHVVNLTIPVNGIVQKTNFLLGDRVLKGQVLVVLDQTVLRANKNKAVQALAYSKEKLKEAEAENNRSKELFERLVLSHHDMTMSKINYLKVKAEYQSQLHELSQVNWGLQYSVIKAPFDGVVIAKNVAVGEQVSVNYYRDPLVSIADNDQVAVKLSLNTVDVQKISLGKKLNIVINNQKYVGKVSKISHSLLEKSKYDVLISLNVKQMVFPGKMAKVVLD